MKKITSILLILSLVFAVFSFVSCGEKPKTAYEIVNEAITNSQQLKKYSCSVDGDITVGAAGITMAMPMSMDIVLDQSDPDNIVCSAGVSTSIFGQTIDMQMYLESDWVYMTMLGESYKVNAKSAEEDLDFSDSVDEILQVLPEELFEGKVMTDNGDGSQSITIELPSEMFAEIFDEAIASAGETAGTTEALENILVSDTKVSITIADGYIKNYDMIYSMETMIEGIAATISVDMSLEYNNIGDGVTITPPAGYQSFPELTEG